MVAAGAALFSGQVVVISGWGFVALVVGIIGMRGGRYPGPARLAGGCAELDIVLSGAGLGSPSFRPGGGNVFSMGTD
jgi:hypothetical protein